MDYASREVADSRSLRPSSDSTSSKAMESCRGLRAWPPAAYFSCFDSYGNPNGPGKVGDLEDAPSTTSSARNEQEQAFREKQQRRKQKKANEEAKIIKAEKIPGHRGEADVEKLLDFITGSTAKKNGKKKPGPVGNNVQENGLTDRSSKTKKVLNEKGQMSSIKSMDDRSSENGSEREDDGSCRMSDVGDDKVKGHDDDLVESAKVSDNGSEGSISSDLIKDITATAAKLDNNKHIIKYEKNDNSKVEVENAFSSGGEEPDSGSSVDMYPHSSLVNDTYIFTDYDSVSLPVEEDFVTVSTKKKKVRSTGPPAPQQPNHHQHFHYYKDNMNGGGGSQYYNSYRESSVSSMGDSRSLGGGMGGAQLAQLPPRGDDRRAPFRPSRPMTRSVTPPPSSFSSSSGQTDYSSDSSGRRSHVVVDKASRDRRAFSPSSSSSIPAAHNNKSSSEEDSDFSMINNQSNDFPSLPTASKSHHEGRRNSTGNVPSEVPDVDSDMESVKSLPLSGSTQRDGGGGGSTSPRGSSAAANIISYARIAAGPRGGGKTSSMSNSTSTASVNSVPSSTVSNSTQSHGHQSTDVTKQQDEGYATTDNSGEGSSVVSNNVSASSSKSEELSSLSGFDGNVIKSSETSDKLTSQSPPPPLHLDHVTNAQNEADAEKPSNDDITDKTAAEKHPVSSTVSIGQESTSSSSVGSSKADKAGDKKDKAVINDAVTNVVSEDDASSSVTGSTSSKSGATTNACKRAAKSKSSVVFLDKKMNKSPKDMEISFGFDENMDTQGEDVAAGIQFGDCAQGMQFGSPTVSYAAGGFVPGIPPSIPPQDVCGAVKGAVSGLNGVISPQDMMAYPPPHAMGIPVNMPRPLPPAAMMMVPPPGAPASGHVMMPPPPTMAMPSPQYMPMPPPSNFPPPGVVTSVPPPVPVSVDSPVMFGGDTDPTDGGVPEVKDAVVARSPADVSNDADFPPLSVSVGKSVHVPETSTSPAAVGNGQKPDVSRAEVTGDGDKIPSKEPLIEFLQPSLSDETAQITLGTDQQQQQQQQVEMEDGSVNLNKLWPSREKDPNYDCGNFMVEQAVSYLRKGKFLAIILLCRLVSTSNEALFCVLIS